VAATATQIAVERPANLGFGRLRIALEQVGRRNDHAVGAVAALMAIVIASPHAETLGVAGVVRSGFCVSFINAGSPVAYDGNSALSQGHF